MVITRAQLLDLGMTPGVIRGRLEGGQLHRLWPGVYAVGRPDLERLGRFKAATLACGDGARLSHGSAADLWRIRRQPDGPVDVAVPAASFPRLGGIRLHRRANLGPTRIVRGIPVGDPVSVLVDLAVDLPVDEVEDAVNEADRLDLIRTAALRAALDDHPPRPGTGRLKAILDAQTFSRAQNALERRFLAIVREAESPAPTTQRCLGRHQAYARTGLCTLRFTHSQVFHRPAHVRAVLLDTFRHLAAP